MQQTLFVFQQKLAEIIVLNTFNTCCNIID